MHELGGGLRAMCQSIARFGRMLWKGTFGRITAARLAKRLLLRHLSPEQRKMFLRKGMFVVEASHTNSRCVIRRGKSRLWRNGNVIGIDDDGFPRRIYSLHSHRKVPRCDELLAQKLWLEAGGRTFCNQLISSRKRLV